MSKFFNKSVVALLVTTGVISGGQLYGETEIEQLKKVVHSGAVIAHINPENADLGRCIAHSLHRMMRLKCYANSSAKSYAKRWEYVNTMSDIATTILDCYFARSNEYAKRYLQEHDFAEMPPHDQGLMSNSCFAPAHRVSFKNNFIAELVKPQVVFALQDTVSSLPDYLNELHQIFYDILPEGQRADTDEFFAQLSSMFAISAL